MGLANADIRKAREMLQDAGLIGSITPVQLVKASNELDKSLKAALQEIANIYAGREGTE